MINKMQEVMVDDQFKYYLNNGQSVKEKFKRY